MMLMPTQKSRDIGARIAQVRRDAGLTPKDFARQIGLWSGTLLQYELGMKRVPRYVVVAIAYVFDCSEAWLLSGQGPRHQVHDRQLSREEVQRMWEIARHCVFWFLAGMVCLWGLYRVHQQ